MMRSSVNLKIIERFNMYDIIKIFYCYGQISIKLPIKNCIFYNKNCFFIFKISNPVVLYILRVHIL